MFVRPLLAATLTLAALAAPARAEPAGGGSAGAPDSVVPHATYEAILPGGDQALLRDRVGGDYQLVRTGDSFQGFQVRSFDRDQLILGSADGSRYVLPLTALPVTAPPPSLPAAVPVPTEAHAVPLAAADQPLDPYAVEPAPADPYADAATAPVAPYDPPALAPEPTVAPAPAPAPVAPPPPRSEAIRLERSELDSALADFTARSKEIQLAVEADRGIRIRDVARGSIFDRLGLHPGDLVRSVAGTRVTSIDDAAPVYARVLRADSFDIVVDRGGAQVTLQVALGRTPTPKR